MQVSAILLVLLAAASQAVPVPKFIAINTIGAGNNVPISPDNPPDVIGVGKREPVVEARAALFYPSKTVPALGNNVPISPDNPPDVIGVGKREPVVEARAIPNPYNKPQIVGGGVAIPTQAPPNPQGVA
ncbi:hypothetical protein HDU99_001561 [Rhizoclosmatium hyalinum]|nr:hypothetical protein HDU99_001561 [Rhizoclosmatium hyalinum]